jgi:hypothetical protein
MVTNRITCISISLYEIIVGDTTDAQEDYHTPHLYDLAPRTSQRAYTQATGQPSRVLRRYNEAASPSRRTPNIRGS